MITPEQVIAAQKSRIEAWFALSGQAFDGAEKLALLNLQVAKSLLGDTAETTMAVLSVKEPQELVALGSSLAKPMGDKVAAYNKQVVEIASATGAEFGKAAKASLQTAQQSALSSIDALLKNAPAGSEGVVALMKSALQGASNAYEGWQKSGQQIADMAAANLAALGDSVAKATPPAGKLKRAA